MKLAAGILGSGYSVPDGVRRNDDPVYAALDQTRNSQGVIESAVFRGLDRRRVLAQGEPIENHVVQASEKAIAEAELDKSQINRLYGYVTLSEYATPNSLYKVHDLLGLSAETMVVPINNEYSNFLVGVIHAAEAVEAGRDCYSLVACGANWTGHMDYTKGHALSIGDAAGAAVVGPSERFVLVDYSVRTLSSQYHGLNLAMRPLPHNGLNALPVDPVTNLPTMTYTMTQTGIEDLAGVVKDAIPATINEVLDRSGVDPSDVTMMTHQGSRVLMDHWKDRVKPAEYLDTLSEHGNMTIATYPVNLAYFIDKIDTPYTVIAAVGCGLHVAVILFRN